MCCDLSHPWLDEKLPLSVLEPHVGTLVGLLEKHPDSTSFHKDVAEMLFRLPFHWLAPYMSTIMGAWRNALETKRGYLELEDSESDEDAETEL